jgi:DNA-binding PadR family transcriptional regulator
MAQGTSARESCPKDIELSLLESPKNFEALVESLKDKYSRGTINKYLGELFKAGLVTRQGRRGPYELTPKGKKEAEREALKKKANTQIDNLGPEDIEFYKKKLDNLEKELKHYKRVARIREFEDFPFLPLTAVIKKLLTLGFSIEDFYDKRHLYSSDPAYKHLLEKMPKHIAVSPDNLDHYFMGFGELSKHDYEFSPDEIEIKLVPTSEVNGVTIYNGDKTRKQHILTEIEVARKYGPGWVILTDRPIKGYYIIGAYKELLQLYEEHFNEEWLSWKEEFELSDEDWEDVGPGVREIMIRGAGRIDLNAEITHYIFSYIAATKDDAFERLKKLLIKQGASLEEAEKWARQIIKKTKTLYP